MNRHNSIINDYYENHFNNLYYSGIQRKGSEYIHKSLEKYWKISNPLNILEVGAGNGEHLKFINKPFNMRTNYFALDFCLPIIKNLNSEEGFRNINLNWVSGNVENLPFEDNTFDRVIATCLFLHLENPFQAYLEIRRVTKPMGEICLAYPTDPGVLNRLVKRLYTYRKAKKLGLKNFELVSALEHRNSIHGLLNIQKYIFQKDELFNFFHPFKFNSWNLNLLVISYIRKLSI